MIDTIESSILARLTNRLSGWRLACDIARYRLMADNPLEEARKRYEDARRILESLAAGRVSLGLPAISAPPTAGGVAYAAPDAVFCDREGF